MGYLTTLLAGTPAPEDDFWYGPAPGTKTAAGVRVNAEGAQKMSAWFRGRDLLATTLAMLPLSMWKRLPNDEGRDLAATHPLADVLHRKPNTWQDAFRWKRQHMYDLIDTGNAYDRIVAGPRGFADQLWPIPPQLVTPRLLETGQKVYDIRDPKTNRTTTETDATIFHLCGVSADGIIGKGVLDYARESVGLGIVLESYASQLFANGAHHSGMLKVPGVPTKEVRESLAAEFVSGVRDFHRPKILAGGAEWMSVSLDPEKAQMILSRKFSVNDIARWLGLPPHMLGDLDRATFSNIEHQGLEFVTYALGPWLSLWEFAINDQLVLRPETYYAEFLRDALVRGDIKTRWETYVAGVNAGILAPNEPRTKENLKKFPGGDTPREPKNITGNATNNTGTTKPAPKADDEEDSQARAVIVASASRLLRKEIKAMQRCAVQHAADQDAFAAAVSEFYAAHVGLVVETLLASQMDAEGYCAGQAAQMVTGVWTEALAIWATPDYAAGVAALLVKEAA